MVHECKQINRVHAYHDHELVADQVAGFEAHLKQCEACQAELHSLRALSMRITTADRPLPSLAFMNQLHDKIDQSTEVNIIRLTRWLTAAAAAILIASLVGLEMTSAQTTTGPIQSWETSAVLGADMTTSAGTSEEHQLARWMVDDLSGRLNNQSDSTSPTGGSGGKHD